MSAGVSDQRMKGQGNQVTNVPKEQQIEAGGEEHAGEGSWRQQQQPYAATISSAQDPYNAAADGAKFSRSSAEEVCSMKKGETQSRIDLKNESNGYYSTAGTAAIPYQAFGVGDGTWSTNGTDPITYLGGYNPHDSYGMDGVFNPTTTPFSAAPFGQPASTFNYFHGNSDFSTWGQFGRAKQYDEYYRQDAVYLQDGVKSVESGMQSLGIGDHKQEKERGPDISLSQPKKTTWASIASQPAKPTPPVHSSGLKKKGPGMPPPPIVPGKHNMDIGTWDIGKSVPPPVAQPPPPVQLSAPLAVPMPHSSPLPQDNSLSHTGVPPPPITSMPPPVAWPPRTPTQRPPPIPQGMPPPPPMVGPPPTNSHISLAPLQPHPTLDKLRHKNIYNPSEFDLDAPGARFFVIKSYSEDDIHRSIKYEIWCSTEHGNKRLDAAFRERERENGIIYLLFSVNGSGHFCGMAQMVSPVDYNSNSSVWSQDKWKGQFRVRWIYVKDVPNVQLRHIRLENNENKPVTNSRDTQEVPHPKGLQVLRIMHGYCHSTSIFDDFIHYEKRQEEEDSKKVTEPPPREQPDSSSRGFREFRENRDHRENREPRGEGRENRGGRDHRDYRDNRDQRDSRDNRDQRDFRDNRDQRDFRDNRDQRDFRDNRDQRDFRDNRDLRDFKDNRDNRHDGREYRNDGREYRDTRDYRDGREQQRDNRDHQRDNRDNVYQRDLQYRPHHSKDRPFDNSRGRGGHARN